MKFWHSKSSYSPNTPEWQTSLQEEGLYVTKLSQSSSSELGGFFSQLEDDGYSSSEKNTHFISWSNVYELRGHTGYSQIFDHLEIPIQGNLRLKLESRGSLEDADFEIFASNWYIEGTPVKREQRLIGAVLNHEEGTSLLSKELWELTKEIRAFAIRPETQRNGYSQRLAWGQIRRLAVASGSELDSFLIRSIVLSPEKLKLEFRKIKIQTDSVIEVLPGFDGAPENWLEKFDRSTTVRDMYEIPTEDGIVQILISQKVRSVLEEIKTFHQRRVAGARGQAFILNPYATLGQEAIDVVDEEQFENALLAADIQYERFTPLVEGDSFGYPLKVVLLIETASKGGPLTSQFHPLSDDALAKFVHALRAALAMNHHLLGWEGYDLELQGDAYENLKMLEDALRERQRPQLMITYAQVYDMSHYASRVSEIGYEKTYYSPFIAKKDEGEGWFPDNILTILSWVPDGQVEPISMPLSPQVLAEFNQKISVAKASGATEINIPGAPVPIPISEAEKISGAFQNIQKDAIARVFDPGKVDGVSGKFAKQRKSPVLLSNIQSIDYTEERRAALTAHGRSAQIPSSKRTEYSLLPHQLEGVAWLQTLFEANQSYNCRGAVLADDMGLGKTYQLLTLMAWAIEQNPDIQPIMVVAPVSLLENWKEEAEKFFDPKIFNVLTAYGSGLAQFRVPRESIEKRLLEEDGLTKFLKPNWIGSSKLVLTTYETLRDLEFSFAAQRWSIMVCDEAQKIKNPAAMVTRAAKKQNVAFKIACTGTPVENTLADIWCLFDFIQPGLLGALNAFGHRYRKPIEAKTETEIMRVEELRALIAPQILRRMKNEVAKDLPQKITVQECRELPISTSQRQLYSWAIEKFKSRHNPSASSPFKNHLGLLHYLRLICTDPRTHGLDIFKPIPLEDYRIQAPKLDWLLRELTRIRQLDEKVIIFCEFRGIQRLLQFYIESCLTLKPDIINGDTPASGSQNESRQKRIKAFQAKEGFGVIILSPVAVGFGVNIQAANHVIHYTRTWNPAKEDQATDRAYRIGQKKDVYVYYPVVRAPDFTTFDVKLDRLLEAKRSLAYDMLNGAGDLSPGEFALEDVLPPNTKVDNSQINLSAALCMNWEYFEALAAVLYAKKGFMTFKTPSTKDHGVDVVALTESKIGSKLIQTKTSGNEDALIGWAGVKDVLGGKAFYESMYSGHNFDLVCLTNQFFDKQTRMHAQLNKVELLEQTDLDQMLADTPVYMHDIEKVLFQDWWQG